MIHVTFEDGEETIFPIVLDEVEVFQPRHLFLVIDHCQFLFLAINTWRI